MDIISQITDLLQAVVPLVAMILLYRSNPPSKAAVDRALDKVEAIADRTPTPLDDVLVDVGRGLNDLRADDVSVKEIDVGIELKPGGNSAA